MCSVTAVDYSCVTSMEAQFCLVLYPQFTIHDLCKRHVPLASYPAFYRYVYETGCLHRWTGADFYCAFALYQRTNEQDLVVVSADNFEDQELIHLKL
jgi:hypothetical protein